MTQIVTDASGQQHEFPDQATPEQIVKALRGPQNFVQRVMGERGGVRPKEGDVQPEVFPNPIGIVGEGIGLAARVARWFKKPSLKGFHEDVLNATAPPGAARITATGKEGVAQLKTAFKDAYAEVAPKLSLSVDEELTKGLQAIAGKLQGMGATSEEVDSFRKIIASNIPDIGEITGKAAQAVNSELGALASKFIKGKSPRDRALGQGLYEAKQAVLDAIKRSSDSGAFEKFRAIDAKYGDFKAVEKAATNAPEGEFTPRQLFTVAKKTEDTRAAAEAGIASEAGKPGILEKLGSQVPIFSPITTTLGKAADALVSSAVEGGGTAATVGTTRLAQRAIDQTQQQTAMPSGLTPAEPQADGSPQSEAIDQILQKYRIQAPASQGDVSVPTSSLQDGGSIPEQSRAAPAQVDMANPIESILDRYRVKPLDRLSDAIMQQESGGRNLVSPAGARGPMQIMPTTFHQYAQAGEYIDNPEHNVRVGKRIVADLYQRYRDPRAVAAAYFSGKPDYTSQKTDATGKTVAGYVNDVMNRMQASQKPPVGA